jgi:periplasmic protein TonB
MFDVVRGRSSAPTRLKPALVVSLLAHAALLAGALVLSHPAPPPPPGPIVKWPVVKPGHRGGGGAPTAPPTTPPKVIGRRSPRTVRATLDIPRPADLPERSPSSSPGSGNTSGDDSLPKGPGDPGDGPECATPPCGGGQGIVSEDVVAEMPVLVSAPEVRLSPEARRGGVEGTVLVRCVITASGTVEGCEVLKGLPLADGAVLAALHGRLYRPAQIAGRAVSVRHNFTVKITQAR